METEKYNREFNNKRFQTNTLTHIMCILHINVVKAKKNHDETNQKSTLRSHCKLP
jgi:hypothetical protein